MAEEHSVLSNEQTFINKLCETLESNPKLTIWKRDRVLNHEGGDYHCLTIFLINIQYDIMYWTKL
jgi:hypothetical protein